MISNPSRDPDEYELTRHGYNQAKDRKIGAHEIRKAIKEGTVDEEFPNKVFDEDPDREFQFAFKLELPVPLWVIVDTRDNKIPTVFYDNEKGALDGSLGGTKFSAEAKYMNMLRNIF